MKSTFVGYGPETLRPAQLDFRPGVSSLNVYGAHFSIELNEVPRAPDVSTPVCCYGMRCMGQSNGLT